jgi:hypothetical protein
MQSLKIKKIFKGVLDKPILNLVVGSGGAKCRNSFGIGQVEIVRYIQGK